MSRSRLYVGVIVAFAVGGGIAGWQTRKKKLAAADHESHAGHATTKSTELSASSPPRFTKASDTTIEAASVPGSPEYNPYRLRGLVSISSIFENEPRNPSWAIPIEGYLKSGIRADLKTLLGADKEPNVDIECRTATCMVTFDKSMAFDKQWQIFNKLYPAAMLSSDKKSHAIYGVFLGGIHKDLKAGDAAGLIRQLASRREGAISNATSDGVAHATTMAEVSKWSALSRESVQ